MAWQRIVVSTGDHVGDPTDILPPVLDGLSRETLSDLPAAFLAETLIELGFVDTGFLWVDLPPARRMIPKSDVQERVNDIGKLGAVFDILNSQPIYFARWFAPNWPAVYFDDEGLLTVLAAAGCTSEEITVITAP